MTSRRVAKMTDLPTPFENAATGVVGEGALSPSAAAPTGPVAEVGPVTIPAVDLQPARPVSPEWTNDRLAKAVKPSIDDAEASEPSLLAHLRPCADNVGIPVGGVLGEVLGDSPQGAALAYARKGWPVFPVNTAEPDGHCSCGKADCQDPGKHPRTTHGFKDASTDPHQIEEWWSRWPDSNIGIATGAVSGLIVIDVDQPEIPEALVDLLGKDLQAAPTVRTGRGGLHLYFRHPGTPVSSRVGLMGLKVDVRADKGYVIAPPSRHAAGSSYRWVTEGEPPTIPDALGQALEEPRPTQDLDISISGSPLTVYEGSRNSTLTSLAGSLRRGAFSPGAIFAALSAENQVRCVPPLDPVEVESIARSISNYPAGVQEGAVTHHRKHLRNYSIGEVRKMAPERLDWKVEGLLAGGLVTNLTSKPKIGKTTLMCAGITAISQGVEFLGRKTASCPIVYLTEENPSTFCEVLSRTGVMDDASVTIVPRMDAYGLTWEQVIEDVNRLLDPLEKALLIVDTLTDWVSLSYDWENSSSAAKDVMRPLRQIAAKGHAVLCLFHSRKGGGGIQDATRGSSAFGGDADILMTLDERKSFPSRRIINAIGRPTATPRKIEIDFDGSDYHVATEADTSVRDQAERDILAMLPHDEADAMLRGDIQKRLSCSDNTADRVLTDLETSGVVKHKPAKTLNNRNSKAYWLVSSE
jgi:hypothetical protein